MLYLGAVFLALFLDLLLIGKKKKTQADAILAVWLLVIAFHTLLFYFRSLFLYPQLLGVEFPFPLLHGPLLYLYARALTGQPVKLAIVFLHFLPPLGIFLYSSPFLLQPIEQKIYIYQHHGIGYETFNAVHSVCVNLSGIGYVIWTILVLRRHRAVILQEFSDTEKINLNWLSYLTYWIGGIWILVLLGNDDYIFGAAALFVLFMGYFGIRQVGVFTTTAHLPEKAPAQPEAVDDDAAGKQKYQKSGLSREAAQQLRNDLASLMQNEKLYRQSELTLADLAAKLNTPANYLSQVINEQEGKNFYDYINTLRLEEFKRIVASPDSDKFTLMGIANDCGFNSKSSFNRYFRKVMGHSPSDYVRNLRKEPAEA